MAFTAAIVTFLIFIVDKLGEAADDSYLCSNVTFHYVTFHCFNGRHCIDGWRKLCLDRSPRCPDGSDMSKELCDRYALFGEWSCCDDEIDIEKVCDGKCDCPSNCDDEDVCRGGRARQLDACPKEEYGSTLFLSSISMTGILILGLLPTCLFHGCCMTLICYHRRSCCFRNTNIGVRGPLTLMNFDHAAAPPPATSPYAPQQSGYNAPPGGYYPPSTAGYSAPLPSAGYGAPPSAGYGAPPPAGYDAPPQGGYGAQPQGGYGAPQEGCGAPQGGYAASLGGENIQPGGITAPPPPYENYAK